MESKNDENNGNNIEKFSCDLDGQLDKLQAIEKNAGFKLKFYMAMDIIFSIASWIALIMVLTDYVELIDAACLFLIAYIYGNKVRHLYSVGITSIDNTAISNDIREIKNILKERG